MKNKKNIFIIIGIILIVLVSIVVILFMNRKEYKLEFPKESENYTNISIDINNDIRTVETSENIQKLLDIIIKEEKVTKKESIQDIPTDMEDEIRIDFTFDKGKTSTIFIYKKNKDYFLEQPYNGIYEISKEEYSSVIDYYDNLKEELKTLEKTSITKRVDNLEPADWLGKSFKTEDLTNDELLRLGFSIFGPVKNFGFLDITFENLNRTYIKGFFGREDGIPKDITCSCGKVIATYNSSNDTYTWDDEFHYLNHKSNVYNEIVDMYKIEDKYIVKTYKIFSDIMMNSSTSEYNFYNTYNAAVNEENKLFIVSNEEEFTSALESLDNSKKVLYTLTFKKISGTYKLINYEMNENK